MVFSSSYLQRKYGSCNSTVIRNGHNLSYDFISNSDGSQRDNQGDIFNIFYFGTVSKWFDQQLLVAIATQLPNVRFVIIGPCDALN